MTLHSSQGCTLAPSSSSNKYTGKSISTDCYAYAASNAGCGVLDGNTSGATFGAGLNARGGGVFATQFGSDGVAIWFLPRDQIPQDVLAGKPDPDSWEIEPSARFAASSCDYDKFFTDQTIIFDITREYDCRCWS